MKKYVVMGGQYVDFYYGSTTTLLGAKRLARKNQEYWDNWAGWHTPSIYRCADCEWAGGNIVLKADAVPIAVYANGEWCSEY